MTTLEWTADDDGIRGVAPWDGSIWHVGRMHHWDGMPWYYSCRVEGQLQHFQATFVSEADALNACETLIERLHADATRQGLLFN